MQTQLLKAIAENDVPTISKLIVRGVNVNDHPRPLLHATLRDRIKIMSLLLDAGADIDAGVQELSSACHAAIGNDSFVALKLLFDRGAKLDDSFLQEAARRSTRDEKILFLLLDRGASIIGLTDDELIDLVAVPSSVGMLRRLLALNVNVGALKGVYGRTLCHHVVLRAPRDANVDELIRAIADAGANVDSADEDGCVTPLQFGATKSLARVLVELGADIDGRDSRLRTALHAAVGSFTWQTDGPCVPLLLALGANVHLANRYGQTACHIAAIRRHYAQLCACLAAGSDVNQPDNEGTTVRMIATRYSFDLPTSAEIDDARRLIAKTRLDLVRQRAFQICMALQPLNITALELCEIMSNSFGALGSLIAFHQWWAIATKVKHFRRV
jgi:ankyrin repeat protein